jgi:putative spermidine/putrescine transport system ATP-binding protein
MTKLSINGLTKRFGDVIAVDKLDLEIADGEFISLLGPSGCGKTTTLRCIAGFEEPSSGQILFDTVDIVGLPAERRNIGMVFQNYALFPHMTVFQNLAFGLETRKLGKAEIGERIDRVVEVVQLSGYEERYPRQLSGGQQQRVALARALVIEPSILLLDEPLANLDAKLREEMRFFIRSLQKRIGITTVYVTHDQAESMVISDRIVVMFDGKIQQIGGPTDIYTRPVSREVADFIGISNFIEGQVSAKNGDNLYSLETALGQIQCSSDDELRQGEKVTVVLRPEAVELAAAKPTNGAVNTIAGKISERFYLGNLAGYKVTCADGTVLQVQEDPWTDFSVGQDIWCAFENRNAWIIRQ